jgi:two-component system phosphate regulon response regulator OmpR
MNKNIFHVLVVDDDDRIRELVKQYLEENNFIVTSAKDALDAKKKLKILKFDILILDIMMPGESGLSLTKEIKNNNTFNCKR